MILEDWWQKKVAKLHRILYCMLECWAILNGTFVDPEFPQGNQWHWLESIVRREDTTVLDFLPPIITNILSLFCPKKGLSRATRQASLPLWTLCCVSYIPVHCASKRTIYYLTAQPNAIVLIQCMIIQPSTSCPVLPWVGHVNSSLNHVLLHFTLH